MQSLLSFPRWNYKLWQALKVWHIYCIGAKVWAPPCCQGLKFLSEVTGIDNEKWSLNKSEWSILWARKQNLWRDLGMESEIPLYSLCREFLPELLFLPLMKWGVNIESLVNPDRGDSWRTGGTQVHLKQPDKVTSAVLTFHSVWCLPGGWQAGERSGEQLSRKSWGETKHSPPGRCCYFSLTAGCRYNSVCFDSSQQSSHRLWKGGPNTMKLWKGLQEHCVRKTLPWHFSPSGSMQKLSQFWNNALGLNRWMFLKVYRQNKV